MPHPGYASARMEYIGRSQPAFRWVSRQIAGLWQSRQHAGIAQFFRLGRCFESRTIFLEYPRFRGRSHRWIQPPISPPMVLHEALDEAPVHHGVFGRFQLRDRLSRRTFRAVRIAIGLRRGSRMERIVVPALRLLKPRDFRRSNDAQSQLRPAPRCRFSRHNLGGPGLPEPS